MATISIRGTGYLIKLDDSGMIITVNFGTIAVINEGGEVILQNGHRQDRRCHDRSAGRRGETRGRPNTDQSQQDDDNILATFTDEPEDFIDMIEKVEQVFQLESGSGYTVAGSGALEDGFADGKIFSAGTSLTVPPVNAVFEDGVLISFDSSRQGRPRGGRRLGRVHWLGALIQSGRS